jgi:D-serine dehydratase
MHLDDLERSLVGPQDKGFPTRQPPLPLQEIGARGWNLLRADLPLPVALLKRSAVEHNSRWMRRFLALSGTSLCPHGKTTMSPQLFSRQLDDGAWGITVATIQQLAVCRAHGVARVLMANQLLGRPEVDYVLAELARDPGFDFYCLVDSLDGVGLLAEAARARPAGRPLQLLLEGGFAGGRTGARDREGALEVARAVRAAAPHLALRGVEGYEGVLSGETPAATAAKVDGFLDFLVHLAEACVRQDLFAPGPILLTAGGSAFYDLVARRFAAHGLDHPIQPVARSGCYLTHDSGLFARAFGDLQTRTPAAREVGDGLRPALEVWAQVQSVPEPKRAILTAGRRDLSYDIELPVPQVWLRPERDERPQPVPEGWRITALNDQHAYLDVPLGTEPRVGDLVGMGISHPCTTFDKWRLLYLVDDAYTVVGGIRTFF